MKWSMWKVAVMSLGRWRVWATFANCQDAERFCDLTRSENPHWQVRVVHPDHKLNPKKEIAA